MNLLKLQNGSDVRGVAIEGVQGENINLSPEIVTSIAAAFAKWVEQKTGKTNLKFAIGRDSRISGESLLNNAAKGIAGLGHTVYDCGLASTPSMFMTIVSSDINTDGAIMITASHLPFNRNGLKFFTKSGGTDKKDIKDILTMAEDIVVSDSIIGKIEKLDFISIYSDILVKYIREKTGMELPFKGSNIIVDAGNGSGGFFAEKILKPLGADTTGSQFLEPDGTFPNHEPNPENKEAMKSIQQTVIKNKADLGIIFDTDVDRAAIVDNNGKSINRNTLIALISAIILKKYPGTTVVTDSVTSTGLKTFIESELGGKHHRFKRGYKNVINESIRLNNEDVESHLAIETSGHCAIKDNYFLDDGAFLVTEILIKYAELKKEGKSLSELIKNLKEPVEAQEMRVKITTKNFKDYGQKIIDGFKEYVSSINGWSLEQPNFEGVRVICDEDNGNGWCLMRMSLHDPVIPINYESDEFGGCEKINSIIMDYLKQFENLDI